MPKRSNAFQTLVAQIQRHLSHGTDYVVEESKTLAHAATGELREVDIVIEGSMADVPIVISFECTASKRRVGSPWVESMIGKHRNLPTHRLILVSKSGFTSPALAAISGEKDVEAFTIDDATDIDWDAYAKNLDRLRFCGFEVKPTQLSAVWQTIPEIDDRGLTIESATQFRKLATGETLMPEALCLDVLRSERVGRILADRYNSDSKVTEYRESVRPADFDAGVEFDVLWIPEPGTWAICFPQGERLLISAEISAKGGIRDIPIEISHQTFNEVYSAHSVIHKPFTNVSKDKGDELVLAITQSPGGNPIVSAEFSDPAFKSKSIEFKKINFGSDNPDEE